MNDIAPNLAVGVVLIAALIVFVYRHRRRRTERLASELLRGYFQSNLPVDQLGQRTREIASEQFIGGAEFYALAISAFQSAADAELRHEAHSFEDEKKLLGMLAALKAEFGLTDRYRIEGWRTGRE